MGRVKRTVSLAVTLTGGTLPVAFSGRRLTPALGIDRWQIDAQAFLWFVPYHQGAVTYFKELGVWTDAAQAHNDHLIARQDALAAAWQEL